MKKRTCRSYVAMAAVFLACSILCGCADRGMSLDLNETEVLRSTQELPESTEQDGGETAAETESLPVAEADPAETDDQKAMILVHVCGAVAYSDVYELEEGSRVVDAIRKAGGFHETAAADYLNLADAVSDGMKIYVPTVKEVEEGNVPQTIVLAGNTELTGSIGAGVVTDMAAPNNGKININTATAEQLTMLSGIGEKRANDIVQYREANGDFKSIEEIKNVSGIGDGIYKNICNDIEV